MAVVLTDDQVAGVARGEGGRMQLDAERERHGVVAGATGTPNGSRSAGEAAA
jgi:hypothetical protein